MEYYRDHKSQIYADMAYRLGKIVTQYEKFVLNEDKFESTLYISVLQSLIVYGNEHIKNMSRREKMNSIFRKNISEIDWGVDDKCWKINTYDEEKNLINFVKRLRNPLSHPTLININSEYPSTGFTTIKDDSYIINNFRFVDSPDTRYNRPKEYSENRIKKLIQDRNNKFPEGISHERISNDSNQKCKLILGGKQFIRISIIDLHKEQLGKFTKCLANYLAQPIQENWDGSTINNLIAA